jgi:nucleotide-binding universal stress UspA family protein
MTIEYAADFARAMEAGVTVLSVAKSEKEIEKAQEAIEYAESILKDAGITVTGKVRVGNPTDEIEEESVNYDLVLVGSHKFGILETLLLSSPSLEIVESSRAPTLVVREKGMD